MTGIRHELSGLREDLQALETELEAELRQVARFADSRIAARAIGTYMRDTGPTQAKNMTDTLRIQRGRLSRAVAGSFGAAGGFGQRESRVRVSIEEGLLHYVKEISVPYANIHERGGTITVTVTSKMRRFFWAKYSETGDEKWKHMALTQKTQFTIKIRPRPYLQPALDDELPVVQREAQRRLLGAMQRRVG